MNRNSSFELLRIILMMMIIVHHCIVHGLGLTSLDPARDTTLVIPDSWMSYSCIINCFCICAVNCFVLISGYFGIMTNRKKIAFLLFALFFYTILFSFIPYLTQAQYLKAITSLLFLSHSSYWFAIDYLFLMAFAPILNIAFERFSKSQLQFFLLSLLLITIYFGFLWGHPANHDGYTLLQFILMYCIGRKIRLVDYSISKTFAISGYILTSVLCGLLMWLMWEKEFPRYAWRITYYNNPFIILSSIFLFLIFKDIKLKSRAINSLAKSSFGIYLIQSSPIAGKLLYSYIKDKAIEYQSIPQSFAGGVS